MSVPVRIRPVATIAAAIALVVALPFASGCSPQPSNGQGTSAPGATISRQVSPGAATAELAAPDVARTSGSAEKAGTPQADKLVVVTEMMQLRVQSVTTALAKVRSLARSAGGDITSLQVSTINQGPIVPMEGVPGRTTIGANAGAETGNAPLQASVTIRVPSKAFQSFTDSIARLGEVLVQSENAEDVTQQHIDMAARLKNLVAEEARFRQFLSRARTIRDALEVERELERVRGEIESLQAQLDYLERQAAMATVTVNMSEPEPIVRPAGTDWGIGSAVTAGIQGMVGLIRVVIVAVLATAPLWVTLGIVAWILIAAARRRRRRRAAEAEAAEQPPDESES